MFGVTCARVHTAHRYLAERLELQEAEVLGQLNGLQVVEEQRHLPLLAAVGLDLLAGLPRPVPLPSDTPPPQIKKRVQKHTLQFY